MDIQLKSSRGIQVVSGESEFLKKRQIFLEGGIDPEIACLITKKVIFLNQESRELPIDLFINSPGGEINSGLLIYDVIQQSAAPIRMFCLGCAYSMAAVLFASGNHGRFITPNGEVMIHEPRIASSLGGTASSVKSVSDSMQNTKKKLDTILAKHTGKSVREVAKATCYDHYFSAEESIAFGLCDEIISDFSIFLGG